MIRVLSSKRHLVLRDSHSSRYIVDPDQQDLTSLGQAMTLSHEIEVISARTRWHPNAEIIWPDTTNTRDTSCGTDKIRMRPSQTQLSN